MCSLHIRKFVYFQMNYFSSSVLKMGRVFIFSFVLLTLTSSYVHSQRQEKSSSVIGRSTQLFAADLFTKLPDGNQLISPILIQSGLSLLPAQGFARNQLIKSLHLTNIDYWAKSYKQFLQSTKNPKNIDIRAASAIFVKDKTHMLNSYKKLMIKYGTKLQSVDFSKPAEVAKEVNQWVQTKTNNKIHDIVDASSLTSATAALLVTALYFNANWEKQFMPEITHKGVFYSNGNEEVKTDMMTQTEKFDYAENEELDAKFLEIPYKNKDYSMTIVLPNQKDGLPNLEAQVSKIFENQNWTMEQVFLTLPKFKFENKVELTDILKKLGLTSIFNDGVSFGNWNTEKLKIKEIIQKTYVDVNEVGTEAAAVMEAEMATRFGFFDIKNFAANHPFLFFVKQKSSGVILFLGRFTNPE